MKKWIVCLSVLLVLSLLLGGVVSCSSKTSTSQPAISQQAETSATGTTILKLAVGIPDGDPMVQALHVWADDFNAAAGGKYQMQIYAGGVLAGTADTFSAVRTRVTEMGHLSIPTLSGSDLAFGVTDVPYLFDTYEANTEFAKLIKDYDSQIMEKKFNQKLLSSWCMGFSELYTVKKQVKTMADTKGLNIAVDKALMAKSALALGGSPVTMDFSEEFPSLQKGVVDAGMITVGGALGMMKYYEVIKYLTVSSKAGGQLGVSINMDVYNSLPANLQKVMIDEGNKYQDSMAGAMKNFNDSSYAEIQQHGVVIYNLPADERAKWKAACASIATDYWSQLGADAQKLKDWAAQANQKYPYTAQ